MRTQAPGVGVRGKKDGRLRAFTRFGQKGGEQFVGDEKPGIAAEGLHCVLDRVKLSIAFSAKQDA